MTTVLVVVLFVMVGCTSELERSDQDTGDVGLDGDASVETDDSGGEAGGKDVDGGDPDAEDAHAGDTDAEDAHAGDAELDTPDVNQEPAEPVDVLVLFLDTGFEMTTPVDIKLNDTWYEYHGIGETDPIWNSALFNARGHILTLDEPLTQVEFDAEQISVDGLNNHGFGHFNYTVQKRHPDTDLTALSGDPESPDYWGYAYEDSMITVARNGYNDTFYPDPEFYQLEVVQEWSNSGKMAVFIGGHGRHHPGFGPDEHPEDDYYDDPDDPVDPIEEPVLVPGEVDIAITFLDGVFFDVTINGVTYPFAGRSENDPNWDYAFGAARGQVITMSHLFATLAIDPDQIRVSGLNNEGFGFFSYKIVNKNADADLYAINDTFDDNPEFWGNPADVDPLGIIVNRSGNTITGTLYPDPYFYLGLLDQTTGSRVFDAIWSDTGKIGISFFNHGQDHPDPAPGLEGAWSP